MEDPMKFETSRRPRKESSTLGTQGLLTLVRNAYGKIRHSKSEDCFPAYRTAEMLRNQERVEQEKTEAIKSVFSKLTIL